MGYLVNPFELLALSQTCLDIKRWWEEIQYAWEVQEEVV